MITRRRLLALLPVATLNAQSRFFRRKPKPPQAAPVLTAFFGTDSAHAPAKGIYSAQFNSGTGQFSQPVLAAATLRPSFLALNPVLHTGDGRRLLYAANEGDAHTSSLTTFAVVPGPNPTLTQLNQVSSGGEGPCYLAVDATGRSAYAANYMGSSIASYVIQADGTLSAPVDRVDFRDKAFGHHGPFPGRQDAPHPHSSMLSPDSRFLIVNDLGNDNIVLFPINPSTARLGSPHLVGSRLPGSGPRHLAFHPNGRWAYGIDELANRIDQYLWNSTHTGLGLEPQAFLTDTAHPVSTLDAGFHGTNTAAEIVVSPGGDFLYASNRGENSLVVFHIDPANGALTFLQRISCGGKTPRHFTLDPTGKWLVCGNQDSASVTVFARDSTSGHLTGPVQTLPIESPMFTLFL